MRASARTTRSPPCARASPVVDVGQHADFRILAPQSSGRLQRQLETLTWIMVSDGKGAQAEVLDPDSFPAWEGRWKVHEPLLKGFETEGPPGVPVGRAFSRAELEAYRNNAEALATEFDGQAAARPTCV
ncbi:unnamed protein product [Prorocentrum cordatum]|uniref:Uncharacterized protein n=1 Tax=Prorocentrum cordatum TaxID=2364126 RepID=A0ABN9X2G9_9DINO|nr:unnamed protein product [Polarella glacialis]